MPSSVIKLPLKLRLLFTVFKFILNLSRRQNGTVNRRLINFFDLKNPPSKTPRKGVVSSDTVIEASRNLWFRLYTPDTTVNGSERLPVVVYFHGGGFVLSSPSSFAFDDWCRQLVRELRTAVVSVNYRLAPEHRFPTQYEDGFDALKFLDDNLDKLPVNVDPKLCFLAGDSAGGNLAHHVAVKASKYEFSRLKLMGLIAIQPFFGGEERTESEIQNSRGPLLSLEDTDWYWKAFLPNGSDRDHPAANVFGPKSTVDLSRVKYPATLILMGGLDILKDWQRKYYDGLKKAGKEVDLLQDSNAFHGSYVFKELPVASFFVKGIQDFMQKHLNKENC
ncbi:hypothetical protein LWI28_001513 [Acer negundo]|uniref:Alpha/beta hydrolase fold-3 domain-containing protein n=1 Tax=Acer negundo TaxID=4023 RepID=A0AAD5NML4_ACENE|nr:hypothetical protein LWI28_001513 [Acer negundo]